MTKPAGAPDRWLVTLTEVGRAAAVAPLAVVAAQAPRAWSHALPPQAAGTTCEDGTLCLPQRGDRMMHPAALAPTPAQVEELKCVVRLLPVMLTLIIYNSVYAQVRAVGGNMRVPWAGTCVDRAGQTVRVRHAVMWPCRLPLTFMPP